MAFEINFYADNKLINVAQTSGLAFFGSTGFGSSILVNEFNSRTFISDGNGTVQGYEVNNIKYKSLSSGNVNNAGSDLPLSGIPNYLASLEIRATNNSAVKIQNAKLYAHERGSGIGVNPVGINVYGAEIIHFYPVQETSVLSGSGDGRWVNMQGTGTYLGLVDSPGTSGRYANYGKVGSPISDTSHSWFIALSLSPTSTGAKLQTLTTELEYI